jgi:DNA-binding transcriptional ArsR family regulator
MIVKSVLNYSQNLDPAFRALADPTRRAILARLSQGPASVKEIAEPLPMSLPAVMQHLAVLEASGLVASDKQGRVRTCRLEAEALIACERWLKERRAEWESRLDRLEAYLEEIKAKEAPSEK